VIECLVLAVSLAGSFLLYMAVRNELVYSYRQRLNDEWYQQSVSRVNQGDYRSLPHPNHRVSYDDMVWRFWVWPLSRFYKPTPSLRIVAEDGPEAKL
jgi:hypothetical protein